METAAIETAISNLANTMRLYVEAHMRLGELFRVDREEAIHNIDRAMEAKLEAFHRLYDVSKHRFAYFDFADCSLLVALRNAIHHRNHPLFQSLQSELWLCDNPSSWRGAAFLLAKHWIRDEPPAVMEYHLKLEDFRTRLEPDGPSPFRDTATPIAHARNRFTLIERELGFEQIRQKATADRYPSKQVYLDLMPIFISAVCRVFKALHAEGVQFRGFDAQAYLVPFTTELEVDLTRLRFRMVRV